MFPSSGYFRGVKCPYYSSGLCDRPYCHFGHVRTPSVPSYTTVSSIADGGNVLTVVSSASVAATSGAASMLSMVGGALKKINGVTDQLSYQQQANKKDTVLQYQPTPIHVLKAKSAGRGLQYDPVSNFSASTSRVTLPSCTKRLHSDDAVMPTKRSKVVVDDVVEAKFSDSDDGQTVDQTCGSGTMPAADNSVSSKRGENRLQQSSTIVQSAVKVSNRGNNSPLKTSSTCLPVSTATLTLSGTQFKLKDCLSTSRTNVTFGSNYVESVKLQSAVLNKDDGSGKQHSLNSKAESVGVEKQLIDKGHSKTSGSSNRSDRKKSDCSKSSKHCTSRTNDNHHHQSSIVASRKQSTEDGHRHDSALIKSDQVKTSENSGNSAREHNQSDDKQHKNHTHDNFGNKDKKVATPKSDGVNSSENKCNVREHKHSDDKHHKNHAHDSSKQTDKKVTASGSHRDRKTGNLSTETSAHSKKIKPSSSGSAGGKHTSSHGLNKGHKTSYNTNCERKQSTNVASGVHSSLEGGSCTASRQSEAVTAVSQKETVTGKESKISSHRHRKHKESACSTDGRSTWPTGGSRAEPCCSRTVTINSCTLADTKLFNAVRNIELFGEDSDTESSLLQSSAPVPVPENQGTRRKSLVGSPTSECSDEVILLQTDDLSDAIDNGDTFEQCQQLYIDLTREQQSRPTTCVSGSNHNLMEVAEDMSASEHCAPVPGKKRVAHISSVVSPMKLNCLPVKKKKKVQITPAQQMLNRFEALQKAASSGSSATVKQSSTVGTGVAMKQSTSHTVGKVDNVTAVHDNAKVPCATKPKDGSRVAHKPVLAVLKKPILKVEGVSKIAVNMRQAYLDRFFDVCVAIYPDDSDARQRAVEEEKSVYERSSSKSIYLNLAVHTLRRLREETSATNAAASTLSPTKNSNSVSHELILAGPKACQTSFSIHRSGKQSHAPSSFSAAVLYRRLKRYLLTEEQLAENGFPQSHASVSGTAVVSIPQQEKSMAVLPSPNSNEKICCRCGKRFIVYANGSYASSEQCVYHWGKAWKKRVAGVIDNSYTCCQGDLNAKGCQIAEHHVHELNKYTCLSGYVKTLPRASSHAAQHDNFGVYALDCEMVYTTAGVELARVTVINSDLKSVYESLVQPEHKIIDYNTRFSGITSQQMHGVKTRLRDVQAVLLSMFDDRTILIGHSLESDFIALKLIHSSVVDTSVVFPHRLGWPYKRALKNLAADLLQRIIQNDVSGHDSREDAKTCMELMLWQLREDVKRELRR